MDPKSKATTCKFRDFETPSHTIQSHQTALPLVNCNSCRASTCFPHLLSQYIHSAEAVQNCNKFKGYDSWHALHYLPSSESFVVRYNQALGKYHEKLETYPIEARLAKVALNYYGTEPDFVKSTIQPGFYDMMLPNWASILRLLIDDD